MKRLTARTSALVIVGLQDRPFRSLPEVARRPALERILQLRQVAERVNVPCVCAELEPRHLGRILPQLSNAHTVEHHGFSAVEGSDLVARLSAWGTTHVVVCGIETHTQVAHTALDLVDAGLDVLVAADAAAASHAATHELALRRMEHGGVGVTSADGVIYEWLPEPRDPAFGELTRQLR